MQFCTSSFVPLDFVYYAAQIRELLNVFDKLTRNIEYLCLLHSILLILSSIRLWSTLIGCLLRADFQLWNCANKRISSAHSASVRRAVRVSFSIVSRKTINTIYITEVGRDWPLQFSYIYQNLFQYSVQEDIEHERRMLLISECHQHTLNLL